MEREREGGKKREAMHETRKTRRDLNFMIRVVILQGKRFVSVSSAWRGRH